jgi:hypothetical protein
MIQCPQCGQALEIHHSSQPLQRLESLNRNKFKLCWIISAPASCEKCGSVIPIELLETELPVDVVISEGASLMSNRNRKRFNPQRGKSAADKRWKNDPVSSEEEDN